MKVNDLQRQVTKFKMPLVETSSKHFSSGLVALNFHLRNHVVDDLRLFGTLSVLGASPFEQYNVSVKQVYKKTFRRSDTCMYDTVNGVECQLESSGFAVKTQTSESENKAKQVKGIKFCETRHLLCAMKKRYSRQRFSLYRQNIQFWMKHYILRSNCSLCSGSTYF